MITKFNTYNESLRDKMTSVPEEDIDKKLDGLLTGNNVDIVGNIFEELRKKDDNITYYEVIDYIAEELNGDFVRTKTLELVKKELGEGKIYNEIKDKMELKNLSVNLRDVNDILYDQDHYMYVELMEDIFNLYDVKELKNIALKTFKDLSNLNYEYTIKENLLYKSKYQTEKICPECGSNDSETLGPADYERKENGDYVRLMGYKCKNCKTVYNVKNDN